MSFEIGLVFIVLVLAFLLMAFDVWSPDAVLLASVGVVTAGGVINLDQAVQQFGNKTIVALGSLYVIAAALRKTGALDYASEFILGKGSRNIRTLLLRMCPGITTYSAFLNNTPVVAMGIPAIRSWAQKYKVPASKLLMPLSFAAIMGGICTLIGTKYQSDCPWSPGK